MGIPEPRFIVQDPPALPAIQLFVLDGHQVRETGYAEWAAQQEAWHENPDLFTVGDDPIGDARVSTRFWGTRHNPPEADLWEGYLFQTAIYVHGEIAEVIGRCSTWEDPEAMHRHTVERLREGMEYGIRHDD